MKVVKSFFLIAGFLILFSACMSSYMGRYVILLEPNINEGKRLPFNTIKKPDEVSHFIDATNENKLNNLEIIFCGKKYDGTLENFLKETKTNSFIVIRNDSILYENYLNGYSRESLNYSFSVSKSVTASILGIAIDKGYIHSVNDKIIKYLPEFDSAKFGDISIRNLIDMNSGIEYDHKDWPWGDEAKSYYSTDIRKLMIKNIETERNPGQKFDYVNYNLFLTGMIFERATGQSITEFFEKNIWNKIGPEFPSKWTIDSRKHQFEKLESGFSATAVDFAKLARLFINGTNLKGEQILTKEWINNIQTIDTSTISCDGYYPKWNLNERLIYHHLWWQFYSKKTKKFEALLAQGLFWQYLYVNPGKNLIVVRMGEEGNGYDQDNYKLFKNIAALVN